MEPNHKFKFHGLEPKNLAAPAEKPKKVTGLSDAPIAPAAVPRPAGMLTGTSKFAIPVAPAANTQPAQPAPNNTQAMSEIMKMFTQITGDMSVLKNHMLTVSNNVTTEPDAEDNTNGRKYHFVEGYVITEELSSNVYCIAGYPQTFPMNQFDVDDIIDWLEEHEPELDNTGDEAVSRAIECKVEDILCQLDDLIEVTGVYGIDDTVFAEFIRAVTNMCTFTRPGIHVPSPTDDPDEDVEESFDGPDDVEDADEPVTECAPVQQTPAEEIPVKEEAPAERVAIDDYPDIEGEEATGIMGSSLQSYTQRINDKVPDEAVANIVSQTRRSIYKDRRLQREYRPDLVGED